MDRRKVLVTGGAGYIGSVLVRILLDSGYSVVALDSLRYGGESIAELLNNEHFEFINGDVRNTKTVEQLMPGIFAVVHLAAIVGDPACAKEPELAVETNLLALKHLYERANALGVDKLVFASTCSNYGKMSDPDKLVNETSQLAPVSLYAKTKVEAEEFLLSQDRNNVCKPTCLRFSTVYGISPRMRFDLTVNEFAKELALGRELIIFGEQFWRPYCHVVDIARSILAVIDSGHDKVSFDVYNVGDTNENYQKQMLVEEIQKQIPDVHVKFVERAEDPRDYRVSFEKIKSALDFQITKTVPDGIRQIKELIDKGLITNPDDRKYHNI